MGLPPIDYSLVGESDILRIFRNFEPRVANQQSSTYEKLHLAVHKYKEP